ncbi:MAG: metallophosphoesterase, partial [bacterium]|nr:metallophosphoesterase [bacterium]
GMVNRLSPDIVCLTGDITEDSRYLPQALSIVEHIQCPVYGVPGNHEYWGGSDLEMVQSSLKRTGGDLLINRAVSIKGGLCLLGLDDMLAGHPELPRMEEASCSAGILMVHCPGYVDTLPDGLKFGLALSGHTHGGQVRLPLIGAMALPDGSGVYQRGLYRTGHGPLYVNSGLGTWFAPFRFLCRPEIALITLSVD